MLPPRLRDLCDECEGSKLSWTGGHLGMFEDGGEDKVPKCLNPGTLSSSSICDQKFHVLYP